MTYPHIRGINSRMNDIIYEYLRFAIPVSFVSVFNHPVMSLYTFDTFGANAEDLHVEIRVHHSWTGPKGPYVAYELFINDAFVERADKPALIKPKVKSKPNMADKLENLVKLCSEKVITQEYESRKIHMLKGFLDTQQSYET